MSMTHQSTLSEDRPGVLRFGGARLALLDIEARFRGLRRQQGLVMVRDPRSRRESVLDAWGAVNDGCVGSGFPLRGNPRGA